MKTQPQRLLESVIPAETGKASPLPWRLEIGEGACFHTGNRVSIVRDYEDGGEKCAETVAEVWPAERAIDLADGKLIVASVNHADKLAEALRECRMALTLDYHGCTKPKKALCDINAAASQAHNKAALALAAYEAAQ